MSLRLSILAVAVTAFLAIGAFAQGAANTAVPEAVANDSGVIGTIMEVEGAATVTPAGQQDAVAAAVGTTIHMNDVIDTGEAGRVFILFIDNTELTLSENTKVTVDKYLYDPDDNTNNSAVYSVLQGTFQYVSGLITKRPDPDVSINTPYGAIGIRGTELWGGNIDNEYGIQVDEGQVSVKNDAGAVTVNQGEGTSMHDRKTMPERARAWTPEKLQRMRSTVFLRRHELLRQRIAGFSGRQQTLRARYKEHMRTHPFKNFERRQNFQQHQNFRQHGNWSHPDEGQRQGRFFNQDRRQGMEQRHERRNENRRRNRKEQ